MKQILLTTVGSDFLDDDKIYPPLANLYLKSYIEKHSTTKVDICDVLKIDAKNIEPGRLSKYSIIGFSSTTPQYKKTLETMQKIRPYLTETFLVVGGPHATFYTEDIKNDGWDFIVKGDGERSLLYLIKNYSDKLKNKVLDNQLSKDEVFDCPAPDRHSEEAKAYLRRYNYNLNGKKATTIMTSRGCPMQCGFCEAAGTVYRPHGLSVIEKEIQDIHKLGYKGVYIFDDTFAFNFSRAEKICELLKQYDLEFRCNGHAKFFNERFADMLVKNGCVEIAFGFESGSNKILESVNKRTTKNDNYKALDIAKKAGIKTIKGFMMLGLPGENHDTIIETIEFLQNAKYLGLSSIQLAIFMPYKGTIIREQLDKGDIDLQMVVPEVSGAYGIKGAESAYEVRTKALSPEDLKYYRDLIMKKWNEGFLT